jgi:hypothetical protein
MRRSGTSNSELASKASRISTWDAAGRCYKEKVDPKYNLLLTSQYKHAGRKEAYASVSGWCDVYYPEQWGPSNYKRD